MSILDVTEDQIFQTLGKGKDPNFKPIEKVRPIVEKPKKTYPTAQYVRPAPVVKISQPVEPAKPEIKVVPMPQPDDSVKKITDDLNELNDRVAGLQKMIKFYIIPQFIVVLVLVLVIISRA